MVKLLNPHIKNTTILDVKNDKVENYLRRGWKLVEGEVWEKPKAKKSKVIPVDESLDPRRNEDHGDGGRDLGLPLPDGAVVKQDMSLVEPAHAPGTNLATLEGKSKEVLLGIATDENIQVDRNAAKPLIKAAIEAEREARAGNPIQEPVSTKAPAEIDPVEEAEADAAVEDLLGAVDADNEQ